MHVSWSRISMSKPAVEGCLAFTRKRSSTRLKYFKKYLANDPTIVIKECKHMQLRI